MERAAAVGERDDPVGRSRRDHDEVAVVRGPDVAVARRLAPVDRPYLGHHCAQPVHRRYGATASTRASVYLYTTAEEVDRFCASLAEVRGYFGVDR